MAATAAIPHAEGETDGPHVHFKSVAPLAYSTIEGAGERCGRDRGNGARRSLAVRSRGSQERNSNICPLNLLGKVESGGVHFLPENQASVILDPSEKPECFSIV